MPTPTRSFECSLGVESSSDPAKRRHLRSYLSLLSALALQLTRSPFTGRN